MKEGEIVDGSFRRFHRDCSFRRYAYQGSIDGYLYGTGYQGRYSYEHIEPATVETGAEVRVPLFINEGEVIEINTTDGSYVGRIRE